MDSALYSDIFKQCILAYHVSDDVDAQLNNPFTDTAFAALLYHKSWIDTVQWHLEDIIRDPAIAPDAALLLKRRIDKSNQERTDMVEQLDDHFMEIFSDAEVKQDATLNTETPGWALDRLSILSLKIYHMHAEAVREDAANDHKEKCDAKLNILLRQQQDLQTSINELLNAIKTGQKKMQVYRQMKMYNDPALNPVLYNTK